MIAVIDLCSRVLFWSLLYLAAARIGAWVTRSELRGLAHLAWDGLAGLPLLIAAWLALGLLRFDRTMVLLVSVGFAGLAIARLRKDPVRRFRGAKPVLRGATTALLLTLAVVAAVGLFWNRVPVLFYDSLAYHFAQPESWILEGRIAPYEWSLHSWFPPGMSVLYGVGLVLGGESWANDANLLLGLGLLLVGFDLGRRTWGPFAGWSVAAALLAVPQILYALAVPAADLAHGTFVAATVGALYVSSDGERSWLRRAAWLAAGALLTKYLGFLVPVAIGALFCAWHRPRSGGPAGRLRQALLFCLPALMLLAPWFVANAVTVGNPVAPILSSWVEVDGLAVDGVEAFTRDARGGLPGWADVQLLVPRLFSADALGIYPAPAWGWAFALWLVVAGTGAALDRAARRALAVAALLFALWFLTYRWERFLIPVTFFVCVALAGTLWRCARRSRVGALLAVAVLLVGVATIPRSLTAIGRYTGASDVFLGRESREDFLERSWPQQRLLQAPGVAWRRTDRILLLGEMRHFRIPVKRTAPTGFNVHPFAVELERAQSAEQVHEGLRRRGFSHLLLDLDWIERSAEEYPSLHSLYENPDKLVSYVDSLGTPLAAEGRRALFRIPEGR